MDYVKVGGSWKKATDSFIKVNGHWEKAVGEYVKVGGHWSDASNLAATKLSYDGTTATDTDGTRYLVNSVEPTTHKAPMHSGTAVTLKEYDKIVLPTTGTSYTFDHKTKTFVVVTTELKDGTYGTIIKLDTNKFSQADLDAFTARPELVLEWGAGTTTIPSAIVKGAKDEILDLNTPIVSILPGFQPYGGNTVTTDANGVVTLTISKNKSGGVYNYFTNPAEGLFSFELISSSIPVMSQMVIQGVGTPSLPLATVSKVITFSNVSAYKGKINFYNLVSGQVLKFKLALHRKADITTSQFGIQQIKVGAGAMNGKDDGRFIQLPLVSNGKHLLKTCTKLIAGDITQVTDTPC